MRKLLTLIAGVVLPLLVVVWFVRGLAPRPDEAPPPPELDVAAASEAQETSPDGRWVLDPDRSFVGYRIVEEWVRTGDEREAVGRTSSVTGEMTIEDETLTSLDVTADLSTLTSDRERRDQAIRPRYLETRRYPTGRLRVSEPVSVTQITPGEPFRTLVGAELTLRDVTRPVTVDVLSAWTGDEVEVVATVPIELADYGINPPSLPGFVFVAGTGDIEVELRFVREPQGTSPS